MARLRRAVVAIVTAVAGWATILMADMAAGTELGGGRLTGPMIDAAYVAALILFAAAALSMFRDRVAAWLTSIGWLLALPWASWLLFPGRWCSVDNCASSYPTFTANPMAFAMLLLPPLAMALRRWRG